MARHRDLCEAKMIRRPSSDLLTSTSLLEAMNSVRIHANGSNNTQENPYRAGTAWRLGVSGGNRCLWERIVSGLESLPEAGAERAVIDGAADLEQQIGASSRPAHLL